MTVRKRVLKRVEGLDERQLLELERELDSLEAKSQSASSDAIARRLEAWRGIAGLLSNPADYEAFEEASRRRPLFGERELDLGNEE